jgi:DNA-binding winged helix-turn-helix (wHTH) protein/tetratricopeptide (TPR) repeat protein
MSAVESPMGKELFEFGPFRVDPEKQALLRGGELIALNPKTFQVLLVLVRHGNQIITKDELMKSVWPDTFVEETNLTRNIFALRKALGDNEQNRYIITVPGQGYRLAEGVRLVSEPDLRIVAASHSKVEIQVRETKRGGWIAAAVIATLVIGAGTIRFFRHRTPALTGKDTIVLADFVNSTGDPVFDETLRQGLAVQLEQSPFLSLIPDRRIHQILQLMGKTAEMPLTAAVANEVCERTGSAAVLEGSIAPIGTRYVLGLRATNCRTGDLLDEEQVQSATKEQILNALSDVARKFRTRVGESISAVAKHDTPLADATTPSLEALKAYSAALRLHSSRGAIAALPLFRRATEIDANFAMAHAWLGRIYADLDESDLAAESISRAWQLRDSTTDREKLWITAAYQTLVTGNLTQAQQTCEAWVQTYPRDAAPHQLLAGMTNKSVGRYEQALAEAQKAIELDPDFAMVYYSLGSNNAYLGRLEPADSAINRAGARGLEIEEFVMLRYDLAFLTGDQAGMDREAARARARPGAASWISNKEAFALAYLGRLHQAREVSARAVSEAEQNAQRERAALWGAGDAVREAFFGNLPEAKKRATATLEQSKDRAVEYGSALALAMSGDSSRTETLANDLDIRFPEDTAVQFSYLPVIRARLALNRGDASNAIELLQTAVPHELGVPPSAISGLFGALYPIYMRGEAYLAEHRGAEAAAEFKKVLDHPGIVVADPIGAMAHLQLGRALAVSGDKAKANIAYQDFFALWKNADRDIPVLTQAEAEYAKLQ